MNVEVPQSELRTLSRLLRALVVAVSTVVVGSAVLLYHFSGTQTVQAAGVIEPRDAMYVRAPFRGRLNEVRVDFDHRVDAGDTIFILDDGDIQGRLAAARGRLTMAAARRRENQVLFSNLRRIHVLRTEKARADCDYARHRLLELEKHELVNRSYVISDSSLAAMPSEIQALESVQLQLAAVRSAEVNVLLAVSDTTDVQRVRSDNEALDAEIAALVEDIQRLASMANEMVIVAPQSGLVLAYELTVRKNDYVDEGELLCVVSKCQEWQVRCHVRETAIPLILIGTKARIRVSTHCPGDGDYDGRVTAVSSAPRIPKTENSDAQGRGRHPEYAIVIGLDEGAVPSECLRLRYGLVASAHIALRPRRLHNLLVERFQRDLG